MNDKILFYSNIPEYSWLSNFHMCPVLIGGTTYRSVEHYYQSEKTRDPRISQWIMDAPTPYLAMRAGRIIEIRKDWSEEMRIHIMTVGVRSKFTYNKELGRKLIATGNARLSEKSNHPLFGGLGRGKDMLGKILMRIREELRDEY